MTRMRLIFWSLLVGVAAAALGSAVTYWLVKGRATGQAPAPQAPSPFLAALDPRVLVAQGSAAKGQWNWAEVTGPNPVRCGTCMRNFVGHCGLDSRQGQYGFIVNDFQHRVWAAIERAGGRVLWSNDGRYKNGQTRRDTFLDGRPNLEREYQYACYRIGDTFGVAHMIGYRQGEFMTVILIVHEQPAPKDGSLLPFEEREVQRQPEEGEIRPGPLGDGPGPVDTKREELNGGKALEDPFKKK